ncbi:hypothetical protein MN2019_11950 [Mycolicibacterium neoaurum]|uniref:hypothetical protein n=1 Tax=Mycolicibacterium neoaurum TaxID=1795 RepID=UPI001BCE384A|nr:hypothetical protein [Mycolicibacterium neoaurum]QVI29935.1 hypothetical protein MN2019_11950 [Mycolicibacterium neoaurum]
MTAADQFQTAMESLAEDTATRARRIANRRNITSADKAVRLAALLQRSNATARTLADAWTSRQVETITGQPAPARGLLPADDSDRLLKAAKTALEDRDTALDRVERLGRSEPLQTAQTSVTEALTGRPAGRGGYLGWVRQLNAGACEVCQRWERNGRVWPADHYMPRHPNCACIPRVVRVTAKPKPVRKRKRT